MTYTKPPMDENGMFKRFSDEKEHPIATGFRLLKDLAENFQRDENIANLGQQSEWLFCPVHKMPLAPKRVEIDGIRCTVGDCGERLVPVQQDKERFKYFSDND